ncbi:hypothetical protein CHCC20335_0436 [Bacillus paralicheniformis]|nr:hypothetical protein CHCC20335_0436 [Bacillus paralicheniformis]
MNFGFLCLQKFRESRPDSFKDGFFRCKLLMKKKFNCYSHVDKLK